MIEDLIGTINSWNQMTLVKHRTRVKSCSTQSLFSVDGEKLNGTLIRLGQYLVNKFLNELTSCMNVYHDLCALSEDFVL